MADIPAVQTLTSSTAFRRALEKYIHDLPPEKHEKDFITKCYDPASPITASAVNDLLETIQQERASHSSVASKIIKRVFCALKVYDGVVNSLASADPMPTAIIWGALSVVLNGAQRYFKIFDTIETQLNAIAYTLECITMHEELFGYCNKMQGLLCDSFLNLLRFWSLVYKELTRPAIQSVARAGLPFSTDRLNGVVDEIQANYKAMVERSSLLEKRDAKTERAQAAAERERCRMKSLMTTITEWLQRSSVCRSNFSRHELLKEQRAEGTCQWLFAHQTYIDWKNGVFTSLWLPAAPGTGKSFLCSSLIEFLEETEPEAAVAYHFYRFDEPSTTQDVLRHMAYQLFIHHAKLSSPCLDIDTLERFADAIRLTGNAEPASCSKRIISSLVEHAPALTYFLVDGADEETSSQETGLLSFIRNLAGDHPLKVRLWASSQNVKNTMAAYAQYTPLHAKHEMNSDMFQYLSSALLKRDLPNDTKRRVLDAQQRDPGTFLCAKLMIDALDDASSPAEMDRVVEEGPTLDKYYLRIFRRLEPKNYVLACNIFGLVAFARRPLRIGELQEAIGILRSRDAAQEPRREAHPHSAAHKSRPLELGQDTQNTFPAISLNPAESPYMRTLLDLFAPLIEVEGTEEDGEDRTCRLYHSTVRAFLLKNEDILFGVLAPGPRICTRLMADTCLLYLAQPRYSTLLTMHNDSDGWRDQTGSPVSSHRLLTYAAKYWNKHLVFSDDPLGKEACHHFLPRIISFITSTNFQTCLQVQSLFIEGQFGHFAPSGQVVHRHTSVRRSLPYWSEDSESNRHYREGYHQFWYEWSRFLNHDFASAYAGQLDRCWWGALGPNNFLSHMPCRYTTFAYERCATEPLPGDSILEPLPSNSIFETIGVTRDEVRILRLETLVRGHAKFVYQVWTINNDTQPVIRLSRSLEIADKHEYLERYVQRSVDDTDAYSNIGPIATFSADCRYLRIGPQIFKENEDGAYETFMADIYDEQYPKYVEEFACYGPYLVVAARNSFFSASTLHCEQQPSRRRRSDNAQAERRDGDHSQTIEEDSTDSEDDIDGASDSLDDVAVNAYESWSECSSRADSNSSEVEGEDESNDDDEGEATHPATSRKNGSAKSNTNKEGFGGADSDGGSESSEDHRLSSHGWPEDSDSDDSSYAYNVGQSQRPFCHRRGMHGIQRPAKFPTVVHATDSDADDENDVDPRAFAYGQIQRYGEEVSSDEDSRRLPTAVCRRTGDAAKKSNQQTSLSVFVPSRGRIFRFARSSYIPLFDSPPVVHPSLPLVVWPLGGGDMLFADIDEGTYFIRKIRSSTPQARPIFMKCHFSSCGTHLHVASLEGRQTPSQTTRQHYREPDTELSLAFVLRTYRLCSKKPCRSPPSLVRYARLQITHYASLSVQRFPFQVTWTDEHLYLACSNPVLTAFRIGLRCAHGSSSNIVAASVVHPREILVLPWSARFREVYFFPANASSPLSRIVVAGIVTRDVRLSPTEKILAPFGCNVDEERDLGGWTDSDEVTEAPKGRRDGRLELPLEKFDPEEDCDLEQFLFLG